MTLIEIECGFILVCKFNYLNDNHYIFEMISHLTDGERHRKECTERVSIVDTVIESSSELLFSITNVSSDPGESNVMTAVITPAHSMHAEQSRNDSPLPVADERTSLFAVQRELRELDERRERDLQRYSELLRQQHNLIRRVSERRGRTLPPSAWTHELSSTRASPPPAHASLDERDEHWIRLLKHQVSQRTLLPRLTPSTSPNGSEHHTLTPSESPDTLKTSAPAETCNVPTQTPIPSSTQLLAPKSDKLPHLKSMQLCERCVQTESNLEEDDTWSTEELASDKETQTRSRHFAEGMTQSEAPTSFRYRRHLEPHSEPNHDWSATLQELLLFCTLDLSAALATDRQLLGELLEGVGAVVAANDASRFAVAQSSLHDLCFGQLKAWLAREFFDELLHLVDRYMQATQDRSIVSSPASSRASEHPSPMSTSPRSLSSNDSSSLFQLPVPPDVPDPCEYGTS